MKISTKLFSILIALMLMFTFAACGNKETNEKPTGNNTQTTSEDKTSSNVKTESESKDKEDVESKDESSSPEPTKKSASELIIGKWSTKIDIAPDLVDAGYDINGSLEVTIYTEFTSSGSLIEKADKTQMSSVLKNVLNQTLRKEIADNNITVEEYEAEIGMTLDEYINEIILVYQNSFTFYAEYKFEDDTLYVKTDDTPFTETVYTFLNDNTLKIYTDSDETTYKRVS